MAREQAPQSKDTSADLLFLLILLAVAVAAAIVGVFGYIAETV